MKIRLTPDTAPDENALYNLILSSLEREGIFGRNLDALFDILTEPREPYEIVVDDPTFEERFNGRGAVLLAVMEAAAESNDCLTVTVIKEN